MEYKMLWSKAYYMNGTEKIEADSPEEAARQIVDSLEAHK